MPTNETNDNNETNKLNAADYKGMSDLYNSTNGNNWTNKTGWDVSSSTPPSADVVNSWYGVTVVDSRVSTWPTTPSAVRYPKVSPICPQWTKCWKTLPM